MRNRTTKSYYIAFRSIAAQQLRYVKTENAMSYNAIMLFLLFSVLDLGTAAAAAGQRYQMEKTENSCVRMDTQTGEMSICEER